MTHPIKSGKFTRFSILSLVAANVLPVIGVLFFDWSLLEILFLYWFESGVIGFYNVFKLIKVSGIIAIFLVPFFMIHYGGFMIGHLVFIFFFFAPDLVHSSFLPSLEFFVQLFNTLKFSIVVLFMSHGVSFFSNFLGNHEYKNSNIVIQMKAPYIRIVTMHLTLLLGGALILQLKEEIFALVVLIIVKTVADFGSYLKEHDLLKALR